MSKDQRLNIPGFVIVMLGIAIVIGALRRAAFKKNEATYGLSVS